MTIPITIDPKELTVKYDILQIVFLNDSGIEEFKKTVEQYIKCGFTILQCFTCSRCRELYPLSKRFDHGFVKAFGIFCKTCGQQVLDKIKNTKNNSQWMFMP